MNKNKSVATFVAICTLCFSSASFSLGNYSGFYLGAQGGYTRSHYDLHTFFDRDFKHDERAGRAYLGYQFNQYVGMETGFTMLAGTKLPHNYGDIKTTDWDLLLKFGATLGDSGTRFDLKGGGAHIMSKFDAHDIAKSVGLDDVSTWKIRAVAGASFSYCINKNFAIDATYFHVFGDPDNASIETPSIDLALLGLSILFTS